MTKSVMDRVEIFAASIIQGNSQADAYRTAYPSAAKWTNQIVAQKASVFAKRPEVKARVEALRGHAMKANEVTAERIVQELARLAFLDPRKLFDESGSPVGVGQLDDDTAAAIAGLDTVMIGNKDAGFGQVLKVKLADKKGALDTLARINGMFKDKVEVKSEGLDKMASLMTFLQAGAGKIKPGAK
jgi:phage terminase small subunit